MTQVDAISRQLGIRATGGITLMKFQVAKSKGLRLRAIITKPEILLADG